MNDVDYDAWFAYLSARLDAAGHRGAALDVADVACGTGSVTVRLAKAGHRVTGIDASSEMLSVAAQKARSAGLSIPFAQQDMRAFALHRPVDAVICACDGVNYLLSESDVRAFFASARNNLRSGGLLLFDVSSRHKLEALGGKTMGVDNPDEALLWQNHYQPKTRVLQMQLTCFVRDGKAFRRFRETHWQKAHESAELRNWLAKEGFHLLGEFGDFTAKPPEMDAARIQFVAKNCGN